MSIDQKELRARVETWRRLNAKKLIPKESHNTVIKRLLNKESEKV